MFDWVDELIDSFLGGIGDNKEAIAVGLGALLPLLGMGSSNTQPVGYQGKIEKYKANREQVPYDYEAEATGGERGPGSLGRRYFSDTVYSLPQGVTRNEDQNAAPEGLRIPTYDEADAFVNQQAQDILAGLTPQDNPFSTPVNYGNNVPTVAEVNQNQQFYDNEVYSRIYQFLLDQGVFEDLELGDDPGGAGSGGGNTGGGGNSNEGVQTNTSGIVNFEIVDGNWVVTYADGSTEVLGPYDPGDGFTQGGESSGYAMGGLANLQQPKGYYLGGATDGMADQIPANIDGMQPARLSDGEFVVPADVVSHLGNGNSNAGAQELYDMMDRIRKARTGTPKQGKQIKPNRFLPN